MFEVIKQIMEAAEGLGTISKFYASDWSNAGEYRVSISGKTGEEIGFEMTVTLTPSKSGWKEEK